MDDAIARIRASAREALAEYHLGIVNGGEPVYPQWAKDCMDALHETDRRIAALREDYLDMERKAVALTVMNVELSERRAGQCVPSQAKDGFFKTFSYGITAGIAFAVIVVELTR